MTGRLLAGTRLMNEIIKKPSPGISYISCFLVPQTRTGQRFKDFLGGNDHETGAGLTSVSFFLAMTVKESCGPVMDEEVKSLVTAWRISPLHAGTINRHISRSVHFHKDNLRHLPRFPDFFVTFRILSSFFSWNRGIIHLKTINWSNHQS